MEIPNLFVFDYEVFAFDWLVVFKRFADGERFVFHNSGTELAEFFRQQEPFLAGFNNKHYDNWIQDSILSGFDPGEVKEVNDYIVAEGIEGWKIPGIERHWIPNTDLMDDCQKGTSLKAFEAHMGMDIKETEVDFNIDRPLTDEELERTKRYCTHDVDATELLLKIRWGYLENKYNLGQAKGIPMGRSLSYTNAKLTAAYLEARRPGKVWKDEREYKVPPQVKTEYIPDIVKDFVARLWDESLSRNEVFSSKIEFEIGGCPVTMGWGGIHGAIPCYTEEASEKRLIRNKDVASLYPNLMRLFGYCSRAIEHPETYAAVLADRIQAKKTGDKAKNLALKLVLNTTYGCMGNGIYDEESGEYTAMNDLYDPLNCRSVCITGQLLLVELACHCARDIPSLRIIQLNTDGIMASFDSEDEPLWQSVTGEWQERTGLVLEEDCGITRIVQKDVNNYVEVVAEGEPKVKGGDLVRGVLTNSNTDFTEFGYPAWGNISGGAFKINNTAVVIARAVIEYLVNGTEPETTIYGDGQILDFQLISKASSKYSRSYQVINGEEVPVQKVNRVYACKNPVMGTLYKVHAETGDVSKVGGLPEHCIVDNDNRLGIDDIDRMWYALKAHETIRAFTGKQFPRKDTRGINRKRKEIEQLWEGL